MLVCICEHVQWRWARNNRPAPRLLQASVDTILEAEPAIGQVPPPLTSFIPDALTYSVPHRVNAGSGVRLVGGGRRSQRCAAAARARAGPGWG
jgi:hypothetical protein